MKYKKIVPLLLVLVIAIVGVITPMLTPSTAAPQTAKNETVLWLDDFEADTLKWLGVGSGSVTISTKMAMSGNACMNVSAYAWNNMETLRQIGSPSYPTLVLTVDFWFSLPSTGFGYFVVGLEYCSANRGIWYRSGIDFSGKYENEIGHWVDIEGWFTGLDWADNYCVWHHASLTVNLIDGNYISLTVDDYTFDLELLGYQCYDRTLEGSPVLWGVAYPYFYSGGGYGPCSILIDDVRLCKQ